MWEVHFYFAVPDYRLRIQWCRSIPAGIDGCRCGCYDFRHQKSRRTGSYYGWSEKISDGELQYKIKTDTLTGKQKVMAEYINNIGGGLDAAVENSLKKKECRQS